jgi:hypothetical protein
MVDADWSITRATGDIRYIGDDHTLSGGTPSYATVIQFHRWLQAFADDPEFGNDDELDIIDKNPSERSTDNIIRLVNGFNVDATAIEHLYDGTIIQGSGTTEERWDGIVNFGNTNAHIQVLQDGALIADDYWNYGKEAGTHTGAVDAAVLTDSTLGATTDEFVGYTIINVTDGSRALITANTATTVTGVLYGGTDNNWDNGDVHHIAVPLNGDAGQGISHRFMVKTREDGNDIDRRRLVGTSRRYGNTYSEFKINGTSQGNNVLALSDSTDLNNTTAFATIDAIADISNTEGLRSIDISGDGTPEEYYSEWDRGANSINTFYERLKLLSADSTTETLNGQNGELHRGVTHSVTYDTETGAPAAATNDKFVYGTYVNTGVVGSGPFVVGESVHEDTATPVWYGRVLSVDTVDTSLIIDVESGTVGNAEGITGQTSGATATTSAAPTGEEIQNAAGEMALFAIDDQGANGVFYGQVTKGVAPIDNTRMYDPADHTDYYTCDSASIERTVSTPFVGVSTGSALIGAYGLGLEAADTAAADTYFDLSNTAITPPNNVTFTASGFISGDYVLCTEDNGTDINFTQMVSDTSATSATQTTISVVAIPSDTPTTAGTKGGIRVERDNTLYSLHRYTSWSSGTNDFTIPSADFSTNQATTPFNVFVSYLDLVTASTSETFSYVYSTDRTHFLRVRDGGATPIKNAEATGVMTDTGGVASVNRIDDT